MRHEAATRDDLRRLAMWLTVEEPQLRPVIDQALDTALRWPREVLGGGEGVSTQLKCRSPSP